MRITRVYIQANLTVGQEFAIGDAAAHYLGHVLRVRQGQLIHVFNGKGGCYEAEIIKSEKKFILIIPLKFLDENRQSPQELILAQGISRGQHMDYTIQKAVELGVTGIVPLFTEFSNVKLDENRAQKRIEHWSRISISACEQSGRNLLPEISEPMAFTEWIEADKNPVRLVLHPGSGSSLSGLTTDNKALTLLCGPEGGLSDDEAEFALAHGYRPVSLGPRILRTETAAIAAIAICQSRWGDV